MKSKIVLFIAGCCGMFLSSCLGTTEYNFDTSKDYQILSFTLINDSIKGLSDVVFTIDQVNGRIFNADSMPYGTVLDQKVLCKIKMGAAVYSCQVYQGASEGIFWNLEDSLDFSGGVRFVTKSPEGTSQKTYMAQVNIHREVPDSMSWSPMPSPWGTKQIREEKVVVLKKNEAENYGADNYYMYTLPAEEKAEYRLYRAPVSSPTNWEELPVSGLPSGEVRLSQLTVFENRLFAVTSKGAFYMSEDGQSWSVAEKAPTVKSLFGCLKALRNASGEIIRPSTLTAVIEKAGGLYWATMNESMQWTEGAAIPVTGFPMEGFAMTTYETGHRSHLLLLGGRDHTHALLNTVWVTDNGLEWVKISKTGTVPFGKQEGASIAVYDGKLFLLSGILADGKASSDIYLSKDGGLNWEKSKSLVLMPNDFKPRGFASIYVDRNHYMYLFGGKATPASAVFNRIWRGRINRLGFNE